MIASWVHIGRLWTNGEPFLAMDADLRPAWRGFSDDQFEQVVELGDEDTGIPVGDARAVLVGADGVVRDDSWIEVFSDDQGRIALVQASGPDYRTALAGALTFPHKDDQEGEVLVVGSGMLAILSAAIDGVGECSGPFVVARPGPAPAVHGPPSPDVDPGLLLEIGDRAFRLKVRWYTVLDDDSCFARWLLIPLRLDDVVIDRDGLVVRGRVLVNSSLGQYVATVEQATGRFPYDDGCEGPDFSRVADDLRAHLMPIDPAAWEVDGCWDTFYWDVTIGDCHSILV